MAEEEKGVVVRLTTTSDRKRYPDGRVITVSQDGHLHVNGEGGINDVVAIFAPTKWSYAEVSK